jgi:NADPH2:quinone reductase
MNMGIRIEQHGGPEVLQYQPLELAPLTADQARIRHRAIGVNFIDTYQRSGLYPLTFPSGLGQEAAGVIEALGENVRGFCVGDRVAYAGGALGAYSQVRNVEAAHLVKLPDGISDETAACAMLQGMTVEYLIRRTYPVEAGQTVLWHAAAGGVGQIAVQWLSSLGVQVIGTAGSEEKVQLARSLGCKHVINYRQENVAQRVQEITSGAGVPVVFDSVGKDTFDSSINSLARRGMLVSFGNASGAVAPFAPLLLAQKGSLFITRPKLGDYIATRAELETSANALFERLVSGAVKLAPSQRYPLAQAAAAHRDLEARKTTGSLILIP